MAIPNLRKGHVDPGWWAALTDCPTRVGVRSPRLRQRNTKGAGEAPQPICAGGEDDVANAVSEGFARGDIGVAKGTVSHECFDSTPLAAGGDAWAQLSARFAVARTVGILLGQDGLSAENRRAGPAAVRDREMTSGSWPSSRKSAWDAKRSGGGHERGRPGR
jgi:hypothetical protein